MFLFEWCHPAQKLALLIMFILAEKHYIAIVIGTLSYHESYRINFEILFPTKSVCCIRLTIYLGTISLFDPAMSSNEVYFQKNQFHFQL